MEVDTIPEVEAVHKTEIDSDVKNEKTPTSCLIEDVMGDIDPNTEAATTNHPDAPIPSLDVGYILYKSMKKNCQSVVKAAEDFIVDEIHHPVISCMREITKADFNNIFQNVNLLLIYSCIVIIIILQSILY